MKIRLSMPSTTSITTRVTSAIQAAGSAASARRLSMMCGGFSEDAAGRDGGRSRGILVLKHNGYRPGGPVIADDIPTSRNETMSKRFRSAYSQFAGSAVDPRQRRAYLTVMSDTLPAATPRRAIWPLAAVSAYLGVLLAIACALWVHYGTAVFFEIVRAGIAGLLLSMTPGENQPRSYPDLSMRPAKPPASSPSSPRFPGRACWPFSRCCLLSSGARRSDRDAVGDRRPVQAGRSERAGGDGGRAEGQAVADLLRLHALSGCLPDGVVRHVRALQGARAGMVIEVGAYFISVDPERDTPAVLKEYLSSFDPRLRGLTGDPAASRRRGEGLSRLFQKVPLDGGGYTMDHTALVYLMNKDGHFIAPFNLKRKPEDARGRSQALSVSCALAAASRREVAGARPCCGLFPAIGRADELENRAPGGDGEQQPVAAVCRMRYQALPSVRAATGR